MKDRQFNAYQGLLDLTALLALSALGSERTYFAPFNGHEASGDLADTEKLHSTVESKLKPSQVKT